MPEIDYDARAAALDDPAAVPDPGPPPEDETPPLGEPMHVHANHNGGAGGEQDEKPAIVLRHIADIVDEHRESEWIKGLHKILERRVIAILAGFRDTLKSFVATHWAMVASISGESVVILSGEGGGLGRRIEAWMKEFAPAKKLRDLKIVALERPVRLNAIEVMLDLVAAIDAAGVIPTLILIDTLSKFTPGMKENASEEVAAFLHLLGSMLRDHYGCTILLVAHAGHGDAKRPRGSSVLMANPDAEYIADRPDPKALNVVVTRDRFKDSPALPPLAYCAKVVGLGRIDRYGEEVTSLVLWEAQAAEVIASKPALRGEAQRKLLAALQEHSPDGSAIWTLEDIRSIGTKKLKLHKSSARSAANFLTMSGHLGATAGGWRLNP
jgi:AAA domain-containing protein